MDSHSETAVCLSTYQPLTWAASGTPAAFRPRDQGRSSASLRKLLEEQARAGTRVRLLLGDPEGRAVAQRGEEEGIGPDAIAAKIRNVLALFQPVHRAGAEIRLHDTVLYNSMYWSDDDLLVNTHVHGYVAACAPVLHLRKIDGGSLVTTYRECFDRIWDGARPWNRS